MQLLQIVLAAKNQQLGLNKSLQPLPTAGVWMTVKNEHDQLRNEQALSQQVTSLIIIIIMMIRSAAAANNVNIASATICTSWAV